VSPALDKCAIQAGDACLYCMDVSSRGSPTNSFNSIRKPEAQLSSILTLRPKKRTWTNGSELRPLAACGYCQRSGAARHPGESSREGNIYFRVRPHALDIRRILRRASAEFELSWSAYSRWPYRGLN
jgi:hypothetical protein